MATLILRPNATGSATINPHTLVGAATNHGCVSESVADEDVTYLKNLQLSVGSQVFTDRMNIDNPPALTGTINSVTIFCRARYVVSGGTDPTVAPTLITESTIVDGTPQTVLVAYANYSQAWVTNPVTGIAWTWTQITALQIGAITEVIGDGISSAEARVTQVWAAVDHNDNFEPGYYTLILDALQPTFTMTAFEDHDTVVFDPRGRVPPSRSVKG